MHFLDPDRATYVCALFGKLVTTCSCQLPRTHLGRLVVRNLRLAEIVCEQDRDRSRLHHSFLYFRCELFKRDHLHFFPNLLLILANSLCHLFFVSFSSISHFVVFVRHQSAKTKKKKKEWNINYRLGFSIQERNGIAWHRLLSRRSVFRLFYVSMCRWYAVSVCVCVCFTRTEIYYKINFRTIRNAFRRHSYLKCNINGRNQLNVRTFDCLPIPRTMPLHGKSWWMNKRRNKNKKKKSKTNNRQNENPKIHNVPYTWMCEIRNRIGISTMPPKRTIRFVYFLFHFYFSTHLRIVWGYFHRFVAWIFRVRKGINACALRREEQQQPAPQ